jgi:signal transduction histidine kinase
MNENLSSVVEERTKKLNQEIEEKDKIQNHLERTNKEYFQITSSIPAMIWRAHYKTDGKFVLEYVSEFIYVLSSKTIEDQKEDPNYWRNEVVHPEDKELYIEFYDNIRTSNLKEAEYNYRIIDKFNKLRWLNEKVIITYRDKKDGNTGLHGVVTDITVLKEIEEKLIAIQEEQKDLIATKDKFFSIISHDLKNPFNAILGFTNLLEENYDSYSAKDHKKFITNISKAATSSFKLVQNLLDWSRAQSKATEPERKEFDISIVVNQAINTVKPAATNKFIRINTEVPYGIQVIADENMIETVIRNLLSNAVKFSIEHEEIKLYIKEENKFVYLSVEDKGVGIEKEDLDNLFKIDKQVRTKGTKNESGTGLGLLLCHEFMKLNMGDIIVKSEPVKGSTFTLKIPKPTED